MNTPSLCADSILLQNSDKFNMNNSVCLVILPRGVYNDAKNIDATERVVWSTQQSLKLKNTGD